MTKNRLKSILFQKVTIGCNLWGNIFQFNQECNMKSKFRWILSAFLVFSVPAPVSAMEMEERAGMEEIGKKKKFGKKKGKKAGKNNGKKSKKGFWSWFGGK